MNITGIKIEVTKLEICCQHFELTDDKVELIIDFNSDNFSKINEININGVSFLKKDNKT